MYSEGAPGALQPRPLADIWQQSKGGWDTESKQTELCFSIGKTAAPQGVVVDPEAKTGVWEFGDVVE